MADAQAPQRDQDVIAYTAFNGVRNDIPPERLSAADLEVCDNVDLDQSGQISRRSGYTRQVPGAAHSLWADPAQEVCLYVAGGALRELFADMSSAARMTLADGAARMSYTRINDRVYFSNGVENGVLDAGVVRTWGLAVPPLPGVTPTVGALPAGTYQYALTWLRADGQESGAPLAGVVEVPAGGGLTFALPVAVDPTVVGKMLYLTTPNGETLFEAATLANALTTFGYANDASELSTPMRTQFLQAPPVGQLVAYYRGRLFVAVGSVLYISEPHGYELFDLRQYLDLDGRITMLAPMTDKERSANTGLNSGMFIGTDKSCGVLIGNDPNDFQYVPKLEYGALHGALAYMDGAQLRDGSTGARPLPVWLTPRGLCVGLPNMEVSNLTLGRFSFPVAGQGAALFMPGPNRFMATGNL